MRDARAEPDGEAGLRLFLAVDVPQSVVLAVTAAIEPWRTSFSNVRWVPPPANWHITLKFLGATAPDRVPWLEETVGDIVSSHRPASVEVHGLGAFPSVERARILWAGVDDTDGGLDALVTDLRRGWRRSSARRCGGSTRISRSPGRSPRSISAHLRGHGARDRTVLDPDRDPLPEPVARGATTYEPLRSFPLAG
jgi:hypothetical protein